MADDLLSQPADHRSGHIVIVGKPNVGKSTLFNALVGERLSIISPKPQTTRNNVLGILTKPRFQMLFLDTPGLLDPRYRLHELMHHQIQAALESADVLLCIVDASDFKHTFDEDTQKAFQKSGIPLILALNKTDLVTPDEVEHYKTLVEQALNPQAILAVSAIAGTQIPELLTTLEQALPLGPQFYPEDMLADQPERFFVAELIREATFAQLRQEVPYAIAVKVEEFRENRPKTYILANIIVEKNSQKGIVIGKGGKTLKSIGKNARKNIEEFLESPVYLDLHVKVYENWRKKDVLLQNLGYSASKPY